LQITVSFFFAYVRRARALKSALRTVALSAHFLAQRAF